jgi:hypothetical protein
MQSGTTGINTPRIYNPVKQGQDQDPERRVHPPLGARTVKRADAFIHEPWKMDPMLQIETGCRIGSDYPEPHCRSPGRRAAGQGEDQRDQTPPGLLGHRAGHRRAACEPQTARAWAGLGQAKTSAQNAQVATASPQLSLDV